ncbi:GntR family transcriptional regulator [Rhodococcus sp. LB1]|uniref:GntR family transcriptional regulator n=1 Tax=Rhodococcus sp. LB1 TaxID=1807499 RepID=UPI00146B6105|nr:GntR family transcriptional regulator [Rhodococcus sp. LB1]
MNTNSRIPRYYAVWRILWSRITSGYYAAGSRLGTEAKLAEQFEVSRVTIREALGMLEAEGLVVRRRSFGTFVADDVQARGAVQFTGYLEDVIYQSDAAETVEYHAETTTEVPADVKSLFGGGPVGVVRRLRMAHGEPRLWLIDYVREDAFAELPEAELRHGSLLSLLDARESAPIVSAHQSIHADVATTDIAEKLDIKTGDPVLYSKRTLYDKDGPLAFVEMYYPGSRFNFEIRLGRAGRNSL